jgi:glycosyltransferase involved in cell wall biosynthesis
MAPSWTVIRGSALRWGGDTRRRYVFDALIKRTGARTVESWSKSDVSAALAGRRFWERRPAFAAAEMVSAPVAEVIRADARPAAVDLHDEPVAAAAALGTPFDADVVARSRAAWALNLELFPTLVVPTRSFAELCGIDTSRTVVAPNGTDTTHIQPAPLPDEPVVGMVSGAGPGRGIETLVEAARMARTALPDLRLSLWLVGTSPAGQRYLDELKERLAPEDWILVGTASYRRLPKSLARTAVLCVPHPPHPYFDVALPVKLADSMAAARPVVVTPREETATVVRAYDAGIVADGDRPDDLAAALLRVLNDRALAARLGANGRRAAVQHLDWSVVGGRLADALLGRRR